MAMAILKDIHSSFRVRLKDENGNTIWTQTERSQCPKCGALITDDPEFQELHMLRNHSGRNL